MHVTPVVVPATTLRLGAFSVEKAEVSALKIQVEAITSFTKMVELSRIPGKQSDRALYLVGAHNLIRSASALKTRRYSR